MDTFALAASFFDFDLVAHRLDRLDVRADKDDAGLDQRLGEACVLGQEAVARMDGLGAGLLGGGDDLGGVEIGLACGGGADADRLVGHLHMQSVAVGVGIDRDRGDAEPPCGPDDAAGDFAPIGNEKLGEHGLGAPCCLAFLRGSLGGSKPASLLGGWRQRLALGRPL